MKQRLSNMELLGMLSMFFVLVVHADFLAFGAPRVADLAVRPLGVSAQYFFECLAICCVDVFVLISGWFGIRFSFRKLWAFLFQIGFYSLGIFMVVAFISPRTALTVMGMKSIFLFNGSDYWFIKAYLVLMLVAPMLNIFCERASRKEFKALLALYLGFMLVYGWLEPASISFTMDGCTALSFIGLYLLGRYMQIHRPRYTTYNRRVYVGVYLVLCLIMTVACIMLLHLGIRPTLDDRLFKYGSPLIMTCAVCLLLYFSKWTFCNKLINVSAKSCVAVYLLHCNCFIFTYYKQGVIKANELGGIILIAAFLIIVFISAILVDRVRIFMWDKIDKLISHAE